MEEPINDLRRKHFQTEDGLIPYLLEAHAIAHLLNTSMDTMRLLIKTGAFCEPAPFNENPDKKTIRWRTEDVAKWLHSLRRINDKGQEIPEELR